jgi:hypothetical protein
MQRRFVLPVLAAVALAALTRVPAGMAAEEAPAPAPAPGTIATVAGTGQTGSSGDGGPATRARLAFPFSVVVDAAGNVLIADVDNYRVRQVSPAGIISTMAGTGKAGFSGDGGPATEARLYPWTLATDGAGNLCIGDDGSVRVRKVMQVFIIRNFS